MATTWIHADESEMDFIARALEFINTCPLDPESRKEFELFVLEVADLCYSPNFDSVDVIHVKEWNKVKGR
jgi:hypothetical protein